MWEDDGRRSMLRGRRSMGEEVDAAFSQGASYPTERKLREIAGKLRRKLRGKLRENCRKKEVRCRNQTPRSLKEQPFCTADTRAPTSTHGGASNKQQVGGEMRKTAGN